MNKSAEHITELMRQLITAEEIPLRNRKFAPETVHEILRYGAIIGSSIEQHKQMDRGMDRARQLIGMAAEANRSCASGTVILAAEMAQSKGRFQRYWHAPPGGLWLTLVLANTLLPESSLLVPMAAGVACCELLRSYAIPAYVKWVNDVHVDNKKISGILAETFTEPRCNEEYILVGIGINVNNDRFPAELAEQATSVKSCLLRESDLEEITARLLVKLRWNIGLLYSEEAKHLEVYGGIGKDGGIRTPDIPEHGHLLLESYKSLTDMFNRRVLFGFNVRENPQFEAKIAGLDSSGGLILELDDGSRLVRHSGEIIYLD